MATQVELPINSIPFQNIDPIGLDNFSDALFDGFIDELGNTNKRPGLSLLNTLGTSKKIDSIYWWENRSLGIIVSDGSVFKVTDSSGTLVNITGDKLLTSGRATFADNGDILVIANGGRMVTTDGTTLTAFITDIDAPTEVSHVAFLDQNLLANEVGTGRFHFANFVSAPTVWDAVDVFTAESNPDNLIALYVNKRTIYLFGTQSTEFWFNDGISPYSRLQGTTTARGAMAKHSTVTVNETIFFFDDRRRLVNLVGLNPSIVNTTFDETIQGFGTVSDCIADYVTVDGKSWILFSFPTENRTFMYDVQGNYWAEWSFFNSFGNQRDRFIGNAYAYFRAFNQHVFGSFKIDELFKMESTVFNDNGRQIRFLKRTGHIDYDTPDQIKRSYRINIRLKSGVGIGAGGNTEPQMILRWRDDGETVFQNSRQIGLKISGNRVFIHQIRNLGQYRARQWEISMTEDVPFLIGKAFEKVDVNEF